MNVYDINAGNKDLITLVNLKILQDKLKILCNS